MDMLSAAQVARDLGTSIPRVVRAIDRIGIEARSASGRYEITPAMVDQIRDALGVAAIVPGRSAAEVRVLAALESAPFGLVSLRAVARRAAVSPTTASKIVRALEQEGIAVRVRRGVAAPGRVIQADVVYADTRSPLWEDLSPALSRVRPARRTARRDRVVPSRLRHLFWNTARSQLRVSTSGSYIAQRLLTTKSLEGISWGARNLAPTDWATAARARGLDEATRALAQNLAERR